MESIDWSVVGGIAAAIIALITLIYMVYSSNKKDNIQLAENIRKAFLARKEWTNEGDIKGKDTIFFNLLITDPSRHIFSGKIIYFDTELEGNKYLMKENELAFHFVGIKKRSITLKLIHTNGYREYGSAKAKLKYINKDSFEIFFSKGFIFNKDRFLPKLPRKTEIFPIETSIIEDSNLQNNTPSRILTNEIISMISPERNYAKVEEVLGLSHKTIDNDWSVFEYITDSSIRFKYSKEELENIKSDIYFLKNANLKVTTLDNKTIHSITIFSRDSSLKIPEKFYLCDTYKNTVGDARICQEIIDIAAIESVRARYDSATAIQNFLGPSRGYITYFISGHLDDEDSSDYNKLVGDKVIGFCLSESEMAFYIYDYELS